MIYSPATGGLYANDGTFIKEVRCPMAMRVKDLHDLPNDSYDKHCFRCQRSILNVDDKTDEQVLAAHTADPSLCIFSTDAGRNVVFLRDDTAKPPERKGLRVIRTARTAREAQEAVLHGDQPLMRRIVSPPDFVATMEVWQHRETGEVTFPEDYRTASRHDDPSGWECVIPPFEYQPDRSAHPVAAYLLPPDLCVGERVLLEDLIDDYRGEDWYMRPSRLASAEAIWNGHDFEVQYDGPRWLVG